MAGVDGRLIVLTSILRLSYSAVQTEQVIACVCSMSLRWQCGWMNRPLHLHGDGGAGEFSSMHTKHSPIASCVLTSWTKLQLASSVDSLAAVPSPLLSSGSTSSMPDSGIAAEGQHADGGYKSGGRDSHLTVSRCIRRESHQT